MLAPTIAAAILLAPATAFANDGLGALGQMVAGFIGAILGGTLPALLLLISFFFVPLVRRSSQGKRWLWCAGVAAVSLLGHLAIAGGAWMLVGRTRHGESAAMVAMVICAAPFFVLALAATITALVTAARPARGPQEAASTTTPTSRVE